MRNLYPKEDARGEVSRRGSATSSANLPVNPLHTKYKVRKLFETEYGEPELSSTGYHDRVSFNCLILVNCLIV